MERKYEISSSISVRVIVPERNNLVEPTVSPPLGRMLSLCSSISSVTVSSVSFNGNVYARIARLFSSEMATIKSLFTSALQHLPTHHQRPNQYSSPISPDDLTGEYLLIEIPDSLSPDAEAALTTLLMETHRNGFTTELTDSEGYPSLFPPGASLFDADKSASRLQDIVSLLDRFTHVFRRRETDVIVLNAARIEENIRIAERDPGKSGTIARQNVDALASCLSALSEDQYRFVDGDAVPASTRDNHIVKFRESILYR